MSQRDEPVYTGKIVNGLMRGQTSFCLYGDDSHQFCNRPKDCVCSCHQKDVVDDANGSAGQETDSGPIENTERPGQAKKSRRK